MSSLIKLESIRNKVAVAGTKEDLKRFVQTGKLCVPSPTDGPWAGCPALGYMADPSYAYGMFDDFIGLAVDDSTAVPTGWQFSADSGGTGPVCALTDASPGGILTIGTDDQADNDGCALAYTANSLGEPFKISQNSGKKLWYGTRLKIGQVTNTYNAFFGLAGSGLDWDILTDNTGDLADNKDVIGFNILEAAGATLKYSFKTSTEKVVAATAATIAAVYKTYNLYFDGATTVYVYIDDVYIGTMDVSDDAFPETGVTPFFALKTAAAASKTMLIDWVKCVQLR